MIMGIIILKKTYTFDKYVSVTMITLGIIICTLMSVQEVKSTVPVTENSVPTTPWDDFFWWVIGIILLTISLFISARLGIYQQILYSHYGKHPREALYYTVCILLDKKNYLYFL
jgi:UDP-xylose/UDP-N-acetylglucosamine transporter B4